MASRVRFVTVAVLGGSALACGGLGSRMASDTMAWSLEPLAPLPDSPEKQQITAWAEEGFVQAQAGELGVGDAGNFKRAVAEAAEDNVLTADEVEAIRAEAEGFTTPGPDSPERQAMLEDMRSRMREKNMKPREPAPAAPKAYDVGSWDLDTLQAHTQALSEGTTCVESGEAGMTMRTCHLKDGSGTVIWQKMSDAGMAEVVGESLALSMTVHREGATLLSVQSNAQNPAVPLVEKWTTGTPEPTEAWIRQTVDADGFEASNCSDLHIEGQQSFSCTLGGDGGKTGTFIVTAKPGVADSAPQPAGGGAIAAVHDGFEVMATIQDPGVHGAVMKRLLEGA